MPITGNAMKDRRRFARSCEHVDVVVTVTAGIERVVCVDCGYVKIDFDHRTCVAFPGGQEINIRETEPALA